MAIYGSEMAGLLTASGRIARTLKRLADEGLLVLVNHKGHYLSYRLTEKGLGVVSSTAMKEVAQRVPASQIMSAFDLIVGFQDVKEALASAISNGRRIHFLLEGPPASAKSLLLEGIRQCVPQAYMAFGSRTSAAGLSDILFEQKPGILLLDEADKMRFDIYAVLLGLMEHAEVIETKTKKTRGIKLETMVVAACNSSARMPREFLSRFGLHVHFPQYTREEFIDVCRGFLTRMGGCEPSLAATIGKTVFDFGLGDVRKARGVWDLMESPIAEEMERVVRLMAKYSGDKKIMAAVQRGRFVGM